MISISAPFYLVAVISILPISINSQFLDPLQVAKKQAALTIPPCRLCTEFTKSFMRGMERTARGKHESGDTAWEEKNMRKYKNSEVRLVDVLEKICQDIDRGEDQCHNLFGEVEEEVEQWFTKHQETNPDLHRWLCIEKLKVCCPANHYGADCSPCPDCAGNGICKGNGTRKGNGKCTCHAGYVGDSCNECDLQYYASFRDDSKLLCSECHAACEKNTGCSGAGPKGCSACRQGWSMQPDQGGCSDVDECAARTHTCDSNEFCVNKDGSFDCLKCDRSCNGCTGDGPDLCDKCSDGYELRNGLCMDIIESRVEEDDTTESNEPNLDEVNELEKDEL